MLELHKPTQVDAQRKAQDYQYGYKLAEAGELIKYCGSNADMLRGYRKACNDCAFAEVSAYLVAQGAQS